jgi:hypothetical protein
MTLTHRTIVLTGLALVIGLSACGVLKDIYLPGGSGWRCKSSDECKDGRRCRLYRHPKHKEPIGLCSKRGDSFNTKSTNSWGGLVVYWFGTFLLLGAVGVLVFRMIFPAKKKGELPAASGNPPPPASGDAPASPPTSPS